MVSILPSARSSWDVIGDMLGQNLSQNLPRAIEQGQQRARGLEAIDQLQAQLQNAGGDINQILPALAKAYTMNPALERSGLGQTYLQRAITGNVFGGQPQPGAQPQPTQSPSQAQPGQPSPVDYVIGEVKAPTEAATPSPFNQFTPEDIDRLSAEYAIKTGNPENYNVRQAQLNTLNQTASNDRNALQDLALGSGIPSDEISRFMNVGSRFDTRNPSQWLEKTKQKYKEVKSYFDQLDTTFIPDIGSGLLGRNRDEKLKRLAEPVQNLVKSGLEDETREYLANQYLSPTEIAELVRPLSKNQEMSIKKFPQGEFRTKPQPPSEWDIFGFPRMGKNNYDEEIVKNPDKIGKMNESLANFFLKNVDKETSLLPLRHELVMEKDYDWRQIPDALKIAQEKGLELTPRQKRELGEINTQPPRQSLGDIFQDWSRFIQYIRGNK